MTEQIPILGMPIPEAARMLGIRESVIKKLIRQGILKTYTIGHRRLVHYPGMLALVEEGLSTRRDARRNPVALDEAQRRYRERVAAAPAPAVEPPAAAPPRRRFPLVRRPEAEVDAAE
jgi:hypothetical protein